MLVHGIFHRDPTKGAYFRGVAERYATLGVRASYPVLGFSNGVADRARRLAAHLDTVWPAGKVNIIAHSIGGLAARDVITRMAYAPRVASLTTISTPHRGTVVADWPGARRRPSRSGTRRNSAAMALVTSGWSSAMRMRTE